MAQALTLERISTLTGISQDEIISLLKARGVEVDPSQGLSKEQVDIIKDSLKKRSTVSVQSKSNSEKKAKPNQITITRTKTASSKKLTLSTTIKPPISQKKPEPVAEKKEVKPTKKEPEPQDEPDEFIDDNIPDTPKVEVVKKLETEIKAITIGEETSLAELARKTNVSEQELTQVFFNNGYMVKKNDPIDFDTASLLLETIGINLEKKVDVPSPQKLATTLHYGEQTPKPPVVTIMGHVDHGKTSLLDYIQSTKVAAKESGGITQHISAYMVKTSRGLVTFLDTPGHEAFSAMRGRGANLTDIIVLIIAANDGIKPQTIESIQHAKATNTPMIVAITKMDIAEAGRVDHVLGELAGHEVVVESWGGEVPMAQISSKTGEGVDDLLELISLQAELLELKAYAQGQVSARVCEAKVDRGRGAVVTLIVESGTLKKGDILSIGPGYGKVRTMTNTLHKSLKEAPPATPVEITGISPLPKAGDIARSYGDEKSARAASEQFIIDAKSNKSKHAMSLDDLLNQQPESHKLSLIVKADTHGSLEAITSILGDIPLEDDVELEIIDAQVGSINSSDVNLAASANAEIIAFHVNIENTAKKLIEQTGAQASQFKIIYQLVDHIKDKLLRLKGPIMKEVNLGFAQVKAVFRSSKFGQIAGCGVTEGLITRGKMARVTRKDKVLFEGEIASIKREKETLTEARKGTECGLGFKGFSDCEVGDLIECYDLEEDV